MASSATLLATLRLEQSLKQHDLSDWYQVFIVGFKKVQELSTESPSKQPSMKSWVVSHVLNCHIGIIIACQVFSFVPGLYRLTICSSSSDLSEPNLMVPMCFRLNNMESLVWLLKKKHVMMSWVSICGNWSKRNYSLFNVYYVAIAKWSDLVNHQTHCAFATWHRDASIEAFQVWWWVLSPLVFLIASNNIIYEYLVILTINYMY